MIEKFESWIAGLDGNPALQYLILAAITLLALILRFYKLGEWSFWFDEINTVARVQARYHDLHTTLNNLPPSSLWIPSSLILTSLAMNFFGTSEWSARIVPAIVGIISVPILYFPIKKMFGAQTGLFSVLLLAISPWHLYWSQNARFYTSLMLLYSLALFLFFFGLERDRLSQMLLAVLLIYFSLSERSIAFFFLPVLVSYLLLLWIFRLSKPSGQRRLNILILGLPLLVFLLDDAYRYLVANSSIFQTLFDYFLGNSNHSPIRLLITIVYRIGIPSMLMGIFGGAYLIAQRQRAGLFLAACAFVPVILLLAISPFIFTVDRYIFITLPFWLILTATAVQALFSSVQGHGKWLAAGVLCVVLAMPISEDALYFSYYKGSRPNWRGAFEVVRQKAQQGDHVYSTQPITSQYYFTEEVGYITNIDLRTNGFEDERVWFLIDNEIGWVEPGLLGWIQENSELIDVVEVQLPGRDLSIRIYLKEAANHRGIK